MSESPPLEQNDSTERLIGAFEQQHPHLLDLACHAALPVLVSPEFAQLLRVNFFVSDGLSYYDVADFLLSPLCKQVGDGLYEMSQATRWSLMRRLVEQPKFGGARLDRIARLLAAYSKQNTSLDSYANYVIAQSHLDNELAERLLEDEVMPGQSFLTEGWVAAIRNEIKRVRYVSSLRSITCLAEYSPHIQAIIEESQNYSPDDGLSIKFKLQPLDALDDVAVTSLSRRSREFDIICTYSLALSTFVQNGWVLTLDELEKLAPLKDGVSDDIFPNVWRELGYFRDHEMESDPKPIGYPFAANTMLLVYDRLHMQELDRSTPTTWEDFRDLARCSAEAKGRGVLAVQGAGLWAYYEWCAICYSMGGGVMRKQFGWEGGLQIPKIIESPQTIDATEFYLSLRPFACYNYEDSGQPEQIEAFLNGEAVLGLLWSDYAFTLCSGDAHERFGFAPIPGDHSPIGGGLFFVNSQSRRKREAAEYVNYLLQPDVQRSIFRRGGSVPLRSAYEDESVPYATALRDSLERGTYMYEAGVEGREVANIVANYVREIWRGDLDVRDGLARASIEIEAARQKYYD